MTQKTLHSGVKAALEFGPIAGFVLAYFWVRNETYVIAGIEYSGFVAVTGLFIPVFLLAMAVQWYLTGKVARMQIVTAVMLVVFGGLGIWFNDPRLFKMKPTAVYLLLALILSIGLLRGQSWLKYVMEDMVPLTQKGWMIFTKRVTAVFFVSAAANELVRRTQSEEFWVMFETLAMPVLIFVFFMSQAGLFAEHVTLKSDDRKS